MKSDLRRAVSRDGYGKTGKSRWVREALEELLDSDPALQLVGVGDALERNDQIDYFQLPEDTTHRVKEAVVLVRRQDPLFPGPQSAVIRAAIRKRLRLNQQQSRAG